MATLTPIAASQMGASPSARKAVKFTISPENTPPQTTKPEMLPVASQLQKDEEKRESSESVGIATGAVEISVPRIPEFAPPIIIEDIEEEREDGENEEFRRRRDESDVSIVNRDSFLSEGKGMEYGISPGLYAGLAFKDVEKQLSNDSGSPSKGTPTSSGLSSRSESADAITALQHDHHAQDGIIIVQ
ncbi:uncharacterized protein [Amphiura filiformis]|uniref:uncharacterized protein isoform X2 n=1 Tax=Amphiura filiformis TaxID=82378 RepID=UPI003B228760